MKDDKFIVCVETRGDCAFCVTCSGNLELNTRDGADKFELNTPQSDLSILAERPLWRRGSAPSGCLSAQRDYTKVKLPNININCLR